MTATAWAALTDPHRRDLLELLRQRPHAVGELVDALELSQPTVSKHLRVLRDAGFVRSSVLAQRRIYAIEPAPLVEIDQWLQPYRLLWNASLDALGKRLDDKAEQTPANTSKKPRSSKEKPT